VLLNLCRATGETEGFVVNRSKASSTAFGSRPCVSMMGCSLSGQQEAQLVAHLRRVVILFDGMRRTAGGHVAAFQGRWGACAPAWA
jgi:hypothetical protein